MPYEHINGANYHYTDSGNGDEVVLFVHGLGWSGRMFADQVEALRTSYRCIAVDLRGQGNSDATESGYDIEQLTADISELIRRLSIAPVHLVGLSMGGFIGMRIALRHPESVRSLALLNTSSAAEPFAKRIKYRFLAWVIRWIGLRPVCDPAMRILFGNTFMTDRLRGEIRDAWCRELLANDRKGIVRAIHGVVNRTAIEPKLGQLRKPTLVIAGDEDRATPPARGRRIADLVPNATLKLISKCGHSSTIEQPSEVSALLEQFLSSHDTPSQP